ncbi:MAG TPA: DUF1036 domain-containing protein [Rhizomicrobium sp.]|nr:DUF1036 domain-containing protein [Rhizomicrobium sp.]
MTRKLGLAVAALVCVVFGAGPASAAMTLCNQTSYVLYAALGFQVGAQAYTQGWTRITPGNCATPKAQPPAASFYFLAARTSQAHSGPSHVWGGPLHYCVKDSDFQLRTPLGAQVCTVDNAYLLSFAPINAKNAGSWTTTLTESPRITSLEVARALGIARLLADAGYKVGLGANKTYDEALKKFRARMKLPEQASIDDLFDALETEAMKASAPAGYSICNDGDADIWAALGLKQGSDWLSRGWWRIAPGACAKAITAPLANDKIWLHAEKSGHNVLVSGPDKFCTTDIEFETHGRDKCTGAGLASAGFAVTNTKGLTGYAAHIGSKGLLAPPQASTSK